LNDWNGSNSLEPTIAKSDFSFAFLNGAILTIACCLVPCLFVNGLNGAKRLNISYLTIA